LSAFRTIAARPHFGREETIRKRMRIHAARRTLMTETASPQLSSDEHARVRRLVDAHGQNEAARILGVSRAALLHALAQLPSRKGTVLLFRHGLAALDRSAA
jgi:predicted DNA-binding protein (UPF0251 family)